MNIVIIGFKGSGKTTVGKVLSRRMKMKFFDLDEMIEKKYNTTIKKLFSKVGEQKFRDIEKEFLIELRKKDNAVISLGGGAPIYNKLLIRVLGNVVYLYQNIEIIRKRLKKIPEHLQPLEKVFMEREKIYKEIADVIIDCDDKTPEEIAKNV